MLQLISFKAGKGDSFLLSWGAQGENNLLIDAGSSGTYRFIRPKLTTGIHLTAILISHVDYDHIGGFFKMFKDLDYKIENTIRVYINTPNLILCPSDTDFVSVEHGIHFEQLLHERAIVPRPLYLKNDTDNLEVINGLSLQILSPDIQIIAELINKWTASEIYEKYQRTNKQNDNKVSTDEEELTPYADILAKPPQPHKWEEDLLNSSSISFIARYERFSILFLADANPLLISAELDRQGITNQNQLVVDLVKISHHGSKHNTTKELLEKIKCNKFLLSTDSTGPYYHPSREAIIQISEYSRTDKETPIIIYTNYAIDVNRFLTKREQKTLNLHFEEIAHLDFPLNEL